MLLTALDPVGLHEQVTAGAETLLRLQLQVLHPLLDASKAGADGIKNLGGM